MSKYRKKPVVIEAFKWTGGINQEEDPIWIVEAIKKGEVLVKKEEIDGNIYLVINTLEGAMVANVGDYVIRGIQGEIYPCKPDIFEATYERVE